MENAIGSAEDALKRDIVVACRILAAAGHGDSIYGHVAGRLVGADRFWIKPGQIGMDEASVESLVQLDLAGRRLAGEAPVHREWPIHAAIFEARPDVSAIVHTHPRFGIALPARGMKLRMLSQDASVFHDGVPVFGEFTGLVETLTLGRAVAATIGPSRALYLLNHGIVVVGEDVAIATVGALMLERASEIQLLAPEGQPANVEDAKSVAAGRLAGARSAFEYRARCLGQV